MAARLLRRRAAILRQWPKALVVQQRPRGGSETQQQQAIEEVEEQQFADLVILLEAMPPNSSTDFVGLGTPPATLDPWLDLGQHAIRRDLLQDMRSGCCPALVVAPPCSSFGIASDRAAPVAARPEGVRCFAVHLARTGGGALGCLLADMPGDLTCLRVVDLREESGLEVHEWNVRCRATYPADAVAKGDIVVRVNDIDRHAANMWRELRRYAQSTTGELLMVMQRVSHEPALLGRT